MDNTAPTFVSAGTNGTDKVVLTYSEALNTTQPATSAFTVKVGGNNRGVDTVAISGSAVTLTLASAFRPGDTLTVSYTKPGSNPIKDAADNEVDRFADRGCHQQPRRHRPGGAGEPRARGPNHCPGHSADEYVDQLDLFWTTPWHNGSDITKYQGTATLRAPRCPATTGWTDIPDSAPTGENSNDYTVTGPRRRHRVHLRGARGERRSATATEASAMDDAAVNWSFTLRDASNNDVTQLTEGGDSATATVSITNNVRFGTDQTVTIQWWQCGSDLPRPRARDATIVDHPREGVQRQPGDHIPQARPGHASQYAPVRGAHGDAWRDRDRSGIELTSVDDEPQPARVSRKRRTTVTKATASTLRSRLSLDPLLVQPDGTARRQDSR